MRKYFLSVAVMMMFALSVTAVPAMAHCGKCGMDEKHEGAAAAQCKPDCDKPCCKDKDKAGKVCDMHGKKDCCDKKHKSHAKMNFGPKHRR